MQIAYTIKEVREQVKAWKKEGAHCRSGADYGLSS